MLATSLRRDQVRQIDQIAIEQYGMSGLVLMENAGRGAAEAIAPLVRGRNPVILAGRGNNAGDGYVIARHLQLLGCEPAIVQLTDPSGLRGDAAVNWRIAQAAEIPTWSVQEEGLEELLQRAGRSDAIVDAMVGTGAHGALREPYSQAAAAANRAAALRIAIDLPSGIDCDTGTAAGECFRADQTMTFVARKRGFESPESKQWTGHVTVIPIGVPRKLLRSVYLH